MKKLIAMGILGLGVFVLVLARCSSTENSTEACRYETTLNLDNGNYDAVLASPCADLMQQGAAWFGKSGYDITDVLNAFIEANSNSDTGTETTKSDLNIYMTTLVGRVDEITLINLDNATTQYSLAAQNTLSTADGYKDAKFSIGLVDAVKCLSVLKMFIDTTGSGTLNTTCDTNSNNRADEIDAASCALLVSDGQTCGTLNSSGAVAVTQDIQNITFAGKSGTYRGLVTTVTGAGLSSTCPNPNEYRKLLFQKASLWAAAATTAQTCQDTSANNSGSWPCPMEYGGKPVDLVSTGNQALTSAMNSLNSAFTSTTSNDVQQSINDIKAQNCCTQPLQPGENLADPSTCVCSSSEFAAYLQTI